MFSRSNESPEAARHAKLGMLVEHNVNDGQSTELKVTTGPAHERRNVVYSYYLESAKNTAGIVVETRRNGVVITIDAVVPIREVIAKVNNRRHGKLRVAVFLKSDRQGNSYFEVHTPKDSYTDVARSTFDIERDPMRPACCVCEDEDCEGAKHEGMFGEDPISLADMFKISSLFRLDRNLFRGGDLDEEDINHEKATAAARNGNGHADSRNGNGRAASSNGNGVPKSQKKPRKKSRGKKKGRGNRRPTMKAKSGRRKVVHS